MVVYRRHLKMPSKIIKMPSKTFLDVLENACYKLDSKGLEAFFQNAFQYQYIKAFSRCL
jgi:hypothetical protein